MSISLLLKAVFVPQQHVIGYDLLLWRNDIALSLLSNKYQGEQL